MCCDSCRESAETKVPLKLQYTQQFLPKPAESFKKVPIAISYSVVIMKIYRNLNQRFLLKGRFHPGSCAVIRAKNLQK
jgi:hypothetical protein